VENQIQQGMFGDPEWVSRLDVVFANRHVATVANLVCNWSLNEARDVAWDTALGLWAVRDHHLATDLLTGALARMVAMATQPLLIAV
jgi:hypothetical protein